MMEVVVFTECPTRDYYRGLVYLEKEGKIKLEFRDSRVLYLLFLRIYGQFLFLRKIGSKYFGKPLNVKRPCIIDDVIPSIKAYLTLPFTKKKVVVLFAPYSWMVVYLLFLKVMRRDVVYMTSWPYWDGKDCVHKATWFKVYLWKKFLKGVSTVTISRTGKENLLRFNRKVVQIPHGVDLSLFYPGEKRVKFSVLYLGRMVKEKGVEGLLEVAKSLPNIEFTFVGSGNMVDKVKDCGLSNVVYLGEIRDRERVAQLFREHHVFVLNSYKVDKWEELYGIVLLEAMASGVSVLSTDCVGPKEIVKEEFGFLVRQKDEEGLKEKLEFFYENPERVEEMGSKGREYAEKNYDVKSLALKWYEVLK